LKNNYGFYCTCKRCEENDIDDPFSSNYICTKFGCGGLLVRKSKSADRICSVCGAIKEEEEEDY